MTDSRENTDTQAHPTHGAMSIAKAIHARAPQLKPGKIQLLLFFAQGHHLAHFGTPLFREQILARRLEGGVLVGLTPLERDELDEASLNTIGYVVERYGNLAPVDLRTLIAASAPWARATSVVAHQDLIDWFRRDDETNDPDDERPSRDERAQVDQLWRDRRNGAVSATALVTRPKVSEGGAE